MQTNNLIFEDYELEKEYRLDSNQFSLLYTIRNSKHLELFLKYTEYLIQVEYQNKMKYFPSRNNMSKDCLHILRWAYSRYKLYTTEKYLLKIKEFIHKEEVLNIPQTNIVHQDVGLHNHMKISAFAWVINTICLLYIYPNIFKEDDFTLDKVIKHIKSIKDDEEKFVLDATKNDGFLYLVGFNSNSSNLYRYLNSLHL